MDRARPVIGLTSRTLSLRSSGRDRPAETVGRSYVEAVARAGGLPVLLPNPDDPGAAAACLDLVDAIVLTGGDDPHPRWFGEEPHPRIEVVDERRDAFEIELVKAARERRVPLLGICRGAQMLNVALGGDIYQDIQAQTDSGVQHSQRTVEDAPWHEIEIADGSVLARQLGRAGALRVNSFHHQACRRLGEGLAAGAVTAGDGLIEAVEDPGLPFFLGVQWHPEIGALRGEEPAIRLFSGFVDSARISAAAASNSRRTALSGR